MKRREPTIRLERVQKALARVGVGSRREVERLVAAGKIRINGRIAQVGESVQPGDRVEVDGGRSFRLQPSANLVRVIAYNKPIGEITSRRDDGGRATVFKRLPKIHGGRWINIGRLDVNTGGLLLFTNHGELAHRLMHPSSQVDREYAARIYGAVDDSMLNRLRRGVDIDGETSRFEDIVRGDGDRANRWYYCVVQSGRNREVRKLWESQGVQVSRLMRVRFGNVMLPTDLRSGRSVELGGRLLEELIQLAGLRAGERF